MKRQLFALLPLLIAVHGAARSEGQLITAQEMIAIIEAGGEQCVKRNLSTQEEQAALQQYFASLLKKRTYQGYLKSTEYAAARSKVAENIEKNGFNNIVCGWLKRLPSTLPSDPMFFEPGT